MTDRLTPVSLTDAELSALDGLVRPEAQAAVDAAMARFRMAEVFPDLRRELSGFVADAVTEAKSQGELRWVSKRIVLCSLHHARAGYYRFKSGPRMGQEDRNRPLSFAGIDVSPAFVKIQDYATTGGCRDCVNEAKPALVEALSTVEAQLPDFLVKPGAPRWTRHKNRCCTKCGWEGHEGQMGRQMTLMGDGYYPATCPECGAGSGHFSRDLELRDGFTIVPKLPAPSDLSRGK